MHTSPLSFSTARHHSSFLLLARQLFSTQQDVYYVNLNIAALSRAGNINASRQLFDKTSPKDTVTWNSMLTAYWQNDFLQHSESLFHSMLIKNVVSWNSIITACVQNDNLNDAFSYFTVMPEKNTASYNAMMSDFVRMGRVEEAQKLFEEMPRPNVVSYTVMIDGYAKKEGGIRRAMALFDAMPNRNEVSWTMMISGLVGNGLYEEAWELFDRMRKKNVVASTSMIIGFCKQGKIEEAWNLFQQIPYKDRASWNIMITDNPMVLIEFLEVAITCVVFLKGVYPPGAFERRRYMNVVVQRACHPQLRYYIHATVSGLLPFIQKNGRGEEALNLFSQMVRTGMQPDDLTFVPLFTACASLALLDEGRQANALVIKHGFDSDLSVSNSLVTMYNKYGEIVNSELAFRQISHPNIVSWNTIIAAFSQHGLYGRARYYFDHMVTVSVTPDGITFLNNFLH
ncbi:unnamed protein product [Vicia faba]|uniref:HORMA domain-containing protein n=1 Tax=Vicia faba TaxID=3906 RepID=A0AAV1AHL2_VICFA|nr:unnamed protein product [Vicia faba]